MEKISVIIFAYNEEDNLPQLFESIKGVDEIILINHNSTDNTAKIASDLGARVITQDNYTDTATKEDVLEFEKVFGFKPKFQENDKLFNSGREKNDIAQKALNDWIFQIDCDERVTWNLEELKKILPNFDQINYKFIHSHNSDGTPQYWFNHCKLYRKTNSKWVGRIHEVIIGNKPRVAVVSSMQLDHYQKPKPYRAIYLPIMEYAVLKDRDTRTTYYLAREYYYNKEYEKALSFFKEYLKTATWRAEISKCYIFMARCLWQIQRGDEARKYCLTAIGMNPNSKEPLEFMAEMSWPEEAKMWIKFSKQVENEKFYL